MYCHQGAVVCLHAVKDLLFSGGEDKIIRAWKFNPGTDLFDPAVGCLGKYIWAYCHRQALTHVFMIRGILE